MATNVTTPVSPKVKAGIIWGAVFAVLGAAVAGGAAAIDPHIFDTLGVFGPLIYSAITLGAGQLAAYLKNDPLRDAGQAAINAAGAEASVPTPVSPAAVEEASSVGTFGGNAAVQQSAPDPAVSEKPSDSVIQQ